MYLCSPSSLKLFSFVFFASLVHDHPVILLLPSQSLLSHALVSECITSHLSVPCVVKTLVSGTQSPTCRDTASRILDR
ncbi:hypothetical protein BU14_0248s0003 [Porphyra umbilicalis]|uniref:Secreted protein n=1 Tax=Porphyra umbilicalis TaxID=2786 RepID=A0A1X6P308_PORUM|nr:hypothetical protein BU14_0248s0003 [Porphyra umbilicalis]|eukprot:OSX75197.1 hypothetical protein BU14_0248s0003 [Porphyra umbilicalis]